MKKTPARILVVDDHPMVRERLAQVIEVESDLTVCGQAEDVADALQLVETCKPDLVIADLQLKHSHGLELIKKLQQECPKIAVLVVSMFDSSLYAERAMRAGACGYVTKQEATKIIVEAIHRVLAGELYFSDALAQRLAAKCASGANAGRAAGVERLTNREFQVFEWIGRGLNTRQIAERMHVDVSTVDTYRWRIKEKLRLRNSSELLQSAIAWVHSAPPTEAEQSNL